MREELEHAQQAHTSLESDLAGALAMQQQEAQSMARERDAAVARALAAETQAADLKQANDKLFLQQQVPARPPHHHIKNPCGSASVLPRMVCMHTPPSSPCQVESLCTCLCSNHITESHGLSCYCRRARMAWSMRFVTRWLLQSAAWTRSAAAMLTHEAGQLCLAKPLSFMLTPYVRCHDWLSEHLRRPYYGRSGARAHTCIGRDE